MRLRLVQIGRRLELVVFQALASGSMPDNRRHDLIEVTGTHPAP